MEEKPIPTVLLPDRRKAWCFRGLIFDRCQGNCLCVRSLHIEDKDGNVINVLEELTRKAELEKELKTAVTLLTEIKAELEELRAQCAT